MKDYPEGVLAIYAANPDEVIDYITVVFAEPKAKKSMFYTCLGMNDRPFHPQGFCQHSECQLGKHLGKKIAFADLNADCQKAVMQDLT